jgi:hypothetical protein
MHVAVAFSLLFFWSVMNSLGENDRILIIGMLERTMYELL